MTTRTTVAAILLFTTITLTGCKPSAPVPKAESATVASTKPNPDAGTITGTIHFTGKPPGRTRIDMSMDPACSMTAAENDAEQFVVANGKLANVYVYIKSGAAPSQAPANTAPVVLDQKGCRYTPHVIALQQGGSVEIRNSDPTMHATHFTAAATGNASPDIAQGPNGKPQSRQFKEPETMLSVGCPIHPWMNAFINVSATPYFAVSAADGSFTIAGLPPGNYVLAAIHEKLGEQDLQISIPPKGTAKADFTYAAK